MDVVVVLPVIDPDTAYFMRYWYGVKKEIRHLFYIIDNSKRGVTKKVDVSGVRRVDYEPKNLGVAGSFNRGVRTQADLVIFACAGLRWLRGARVVLEKMIERCNEYGVLTNEYFHLLGFTRKTFETIGMFDEKFHPGYFEDSDFLVRLDRAGIFNNTTQLLPKVKTHWTYTNYESRANTLTKGLIPRARLDKCKEKFQKKWGHTSHILAPWETPYNNGGPLDQGCRVPWLLN